MDMRGHNSMPYGETLWSDVETILGDDHEKLFHFAKWHIDDYIAGTEGMGLEIEGAYIRFLMRLYRRGKPLPDDDRFMSISMGLSLRVWKRIKDSLVSIGKIICRAGCLTNARFEKERRDRAEQLRKQADGAHKRWKEHREKTAGSEKVSPKVQESLGEVSGKLSANSGEKHNEINETDNGQPYILNIVVEKDSNNPLLNPPEGGKPKRTAKRGDRSRLSIDWELPPEWRARTREKFHATDVQIDKEAERFRRYWTSPDAKNPMKADWLGTWENWFDRAMERGIKNGKVNGASWSLNGSYIGDML